MAQELDDGEFWLPSEFLTDDDLLTDFKTESFTKQTYPYGFGLNTDLGSPVESVIGSTETESDEDDFITGLTRKIANCNLSSEYAAKGLKLSGSPQSTLCGCKTGSNRGSPNSVTRVSSPPVAKDAVGLDLLYAAAGEIARIRMIEEKLAFHSANRFAPLKNPNSVSGFDPNPNPNPIQTHLSYQQLQAKQFQQMKQKQQQMMSNGGWGQNGNSCYQLQDGRRNGAGKITSLPLSAWPTPQQSQQIQQQTGSGMRAVFLGETGPKKERTGTGVFLPRRFGSNPPDTRKKPGCSVLLPDRVVQALNLNLDSVDSQPQIIRSNGYFTPGPEYDSALKYGNNVSMDQQRRNLRPQRSMMMNQEIRLPQEWTY